MKFPAEKHPEKRSAKRRGKRGERLPTAPGELSAAERAAQIAEHRAAFCEYLRASRARTTLSLDDIARETKIPRRSLERLETGRFEELPADVFVRGFLRSYARCVGIDGDEAIGRYSGCGLTPAPVASDEAKALLRASAVADTLAPASRASQFRSASRSVELLDEQSTPRKRDAFEVVPLSDDIDELESEHRAPIDLGQAASASTDLTTETTTSDGTAANATAGNVTAPSAIDAEAVLASHPALAISSDAALAITQEAAAPPSLETSETVGDTESLVEPLAQSATAIAAIEEVPDADEEGDTAASSRRGETRKQRKRRRRRERKAKQRARVSGQMTLPPTAAVVATDEVVTAVEDTGIEVAAVEVAAIEGAAATSNTTHMEVAPTSFEVAEEREPASVPAPVCAGEVDPEWLAVLETTIPAAAPAVSDNTADETALESAAVVVDVPAEVHDDLYESFQVVTPVQPVLEVAATTSTLPAPTLIIDDDNPEAAETEREARAALERADDTKRSFIPPALLDPDDGSRRGALTLAVIILVIVATLTMSYLLRRPNSSGEGVTQRDVVAPAVPAARDRG